MAEVESVPLATGAQRRRVIWEAASLALVMLVVVGAGILGLWMTSRQDIKTQYHRSLINLAQIAATLVDAQLHQSIQRPEQLNDPDYRRAVEPLRKLRNALPDLHYVYTLVRDHGTFRFVLDAADPDAKSPSGRSEQSGVGEVYMSDSPEMYEVFGDSTHPGVPVAAAEPFTDSWGTFMGGLAPLRDATGHQYGAIGVDVDATRYLTRLRESRNHALLGLLPAGVLVILFGIVYYHVRLRGLVAVAAHKAMQKAMLDAAQEDRLTGLPNRAVFMDRLNEVMRREPRRRLAVLFLDFDRFKLINDTRGHEAGDQLLHQIARRLRAVLLPGADPQGDAPETLVSRFGGDEFLVLIEAAEGEREPEVLAKRLLETLAQSYTLRGGEVHCLASIGIVICEANARPSSAAEIVRNADVAMYEAKHAGRGCFVVFDESMHARVARHVAIENLLHRSIGSPEMDLQYQPIVDLKTGRKCHVEALLRWQHPTLGLIEPRELIPIAEESGLMAPLGHWVLERACQSMVGWRGLDPQNAPERVCVNISGAELGLGERLLTQLTGILEATGLPPECLQLEVAERDIMRNPEASRELLREIRRAGIKVAMDDFGTGQLALTLLRGHEFDSIKIDSCFFQDLNSRQEALAVIHATINLIENLDMASVATGVEDATQVAILQSLGCRYAQGRYFSAPVSADEVLEMVKARPTPQMVH